MIDGMALDGETFVVALGIGQDGRETVLGLGRSGCGSLLISGSRR
jgi:hypothetical protein